jgi:hypothetical protein
MTSRKPFPSFAWRRVSALRNVTLAGISLALCLLFLSIQSPAQQLAKRLILKDGSYQLATKWEIKGERVHYFSAERNDWEDVPNSLVDWAATAKFEKDRAAGEPVPEAMELDKEIAAERRAEEAKSPEVVPGLRLPDDGDVFVLDIFHTEPQLVELQQNNAELNEDTKHNVLRTAINPLAGSKQDLALQGLHSKIQAHVALPSIYVKFEAEANEEGPHQSGESSGPAKKADEETPDRFHIVRLVPKQDHRILGTVKVTISGKVSQQQDFIPVKIQQLTGGWAKITPSSDLTSGEYALVELLGKDGMNAGVWDFGINPAAPANATVLKPEVKPNLNQQIKLQPR